MEETDDRNDRKLSRVSPIIFTAQTLRSWERLPLVAFLFSVLELLCMERSFNAKLNPLRRVAINILEQDK